MQACSFPSLSRAPNTTTRIGSIFLERLRHKQPMSSTSRSTDQSNARVDHVLTEMAFLERRTILPPGESWLVRTQVPRNGTTYHRLYIM